jgi:hypothetical protein
MLIAQYYVFKLFPQLSIASHEAQKTSAVFYGQFLLKLFLTYRLEARVGIILPYPVTLIEKFTALIEFTYEVVWVKVS